MSTPTVWMNMNGLKHYQRHHINGCWDTVTSRDRRIATIEESLRSHITPEIAMIDALRGRIAHLKSEFQCIQDRCGSKIIMAQILESLKDLQGRA
jgi:hypothetical protein